MVSGERGRILRQIQEVGVIAKLPGDLPLQSVVMLADALLAAPVMGVAVTWHGRLAPPVLMDLCGRANGNMLVGVYGLETAAEVETAVAAGAKFISSGRFDKEIMTACQKQNILYMPEVISVFAAQAAWQAGCRLVGLVTGGASGPEYLQTLREIVPELAVIVEGEITPAELDPYVQAGAAGFVIGRSIFTGEDQPMSDIISNARLLQQAWETAQAETTRP